MQHGKVETAARLHLTGTPGIAVAPEIAARALGEGHRAPDARIVEAAEGQYAGPAGHGACIVVTTFRFVEGAAFRSVETVSDGLDALQTVSLHTFVYHTYGSAVLETRHRLGEIGEGDLQPSVGLGGHQRACQHGGYRGLALRFYIDGNEGRVVAPRHGAEPLARYVHDFPVAQFAAATQRHSSCADATKRQGNFVQVAAVVMAQYGPLTGLPFIGRRSDGQEETEGKG